MSDEPQAAPQAPAPEKKKRAQKRFSTEADINAAIDDANRDVIWCNQEAEIIDKWADVLRDYPTRGMQLRELRDKAEKLRKRANNIVDAKLKKLKNAMAAMKTQTMPFIGEDKSVVV